MPETLRLNSIVIYTDEDAAYLHCENCLSNLGYIGGFSIAEIIEKIGEHTC